MHCSEQRKLIAQIAKSAGRNDFRPDRRKLLSRAITASVATSVMLSTCTIAGVSLLAPPALAKHASGIDWKTSYAQGERYLKVKSYPQAELCFRQALKDVRLTPSRTAADELMCTLAVADVLYLQDRIDETMPLYKKALKIADRKSGKDSPKTVPEILRIATLYENEGDWKKSEKFYNRALAITADTSGPNSIDYADYQHRLGRVKVAEGLFREGEDCFYSSLSIAMNQTRLPDTYNVEEVLIDYINLLLKTQDRGKVLKSAFQFELLKDEVGLLKKKRAVPPSNFTTAVSVQLADKAAQAVGVGPDAVAGSQSSASTLGPGIGTTGDTASETTSGAGTGTTAGADSGSHGETTVRQNSNDSVGTGGRRYSDFAALEKLNQQRITFYERMIATDIDSLGKDHPSVARDLCGLASVYLKQHDYDKARPLLVRALEIYRNVYNEDSAPVRHTSLLLRLLAEEQAPGATSIDVSFREKLPRIPIEAQTIETAVRLNDLSFMLYSQGHLDAALQTYYWALASTTGATGADSLLASASMSDMSRILRLKGRGDEARALEETSRAILRRDVLEKRSKLLP
jgi:tetratricopeptide (TPR) repeat protein